MFSSKDLFFTPAVSTGYTVSKSLRFRASASAYLGRTPASAGNRKTWTLSFWVKRGALTTRQFIAANCDSAGQNGFYFEFDAADKLNVADYSTAYVWQLNTTQVFRDPSAWYHIVVAVDTTQATASNRVKIYVNGSQVTAFGTASYPSLNLDAYWNNTSPAAIGRPGAVTNLYFDGYLAEVNSIDGQALTPSSFGAYDTNGVWQPARYAGTYGTNGFYLPFNLNTTSTYAGVFNGSAQYLSIANNSALYLPGSTNFTAEAWVNSSSLTLQRLFSYANASAPTGNDISWGAYFTPGGTIGFYQYTGLTTNNFTATVNAPIGQWFHVAFVNNSGTVTIYVNGVASGSATAQTTPNNSGTFIFTIGNYSSSGYITGQVSNARIVKGTAVYTSNFTPPTSNLTAITNTSLLTLQNNTIIDNSSNAFTITNIGAVTTTTATPFVANVTADASGQNNGWVPANINATSSGTTYDSMLDSPTNAAGNIGNYSVLNSAAPANGIAISQANLYITGSATADWRKAASTIAVNSGKWYFEVAFINLGVYGYIIPGIESLAASLSNAPGQYYGSLTNSYGYFSNTGNKYTNATPSAYGATFTTNDVIGVAVDLDNGAVYFGKQTGGTGSIVWQNSGDPTSGSSRTGAAFTFSTGLSYVMGCAAYQSEQVAINFGQRPFSATIPSGYSAVNTQNLTTPTIANGAQYMAAVLYTGTGSSQTITTSSSNSGNNPNGTTFQPDFVWAKGRSGATDHALYDAVRGVQLQLESNTTTAETTETTGLTAFTSSGFTTGALAQMNTNTATYVAWEWNAGGSTVTNTSGSITSSVRANTSAGFSVVTYTGTGANATVGHGLGVAPSMIIVKNRSSGADNWQVYHSSLTSAAYRLRLNTTDAQDSVPTMWNSTAPTSTVFSVGTQTGSNGSTNLMVAYCFAPVAGYSAFGSYTGNGSADGPFVYTGFRPRFVMSKRTDSTGDWNMIDTSRSTYNVTDNVIWANLSNADSAGQGIDITSNGFKIRNTGLVSNASGGTYIYAAFAENPFKISRAR